jgi:pimeloyl-ACP methyl ester carboxylesterase
MRIELVEQTLMREQGGRPALWLIHGFGESGLSLRPFFTTPLAKSFGLFVPDLPGFGASPPLQGVTSIDRLADVVTDLIGRRTPEGPLGLVGHSLGSAVAVRVAQRLGARVVGLLSLEGNLTEADAYFSGRAALFDEPEPFKAALEQHVWGLAQENQTFRRYFANLALSDPRALWQLGLDVARSSRGHALGEEYRKLSCPSLYCWSASSASEVTQRYLRKHRIAEQRYEGAGHWPMVESPLAIAAVIADFFRGRLSSSGPASSR